jgi:hypothetical protein
MRGSDHGCQSVWHYWFFDRTTESIFDLAFFEMQRIEESCGRRATDAGEGNPRSGDASQRREFALGDSIRDDPRRFDTFEPCGPKLIDR